MMWYSLEALNEALLMSTHNMVCGQNLSQNYYQILLHSNSSCMCKHLIWSISADTDNGYCCIHSQIHRGKALMRLSECAGRAWVSLFAYGIRALSMYHMDSANKNMSLGICGHWRPRSACTFIQSDLGIPCLPTESLVSIECMNQNWKQRSWRYFVHRMIWMRIFQKFKGTFKLDMLTLVMLNELSCHAHFLFQADRITWF